MPFELLLAAQLAMLSRGQEPGSSLRLAFTFDVINSDMEAQEWTLCRHWHPSHGHVPSQNETIQTNVVPESRTSR